MTDPALQFRAIQVANMFALFFNGRELMAQSSHAGAIGLFLIAALIVSFLMAVFPAGRAALTEESGETRSGTEG